jgi:formyltetrahydrofolate deformylase
VPAQSRHEFILTIACPDKPGIVYAVSSSLVQNSADILSSRQYGERTESSVTSRPGSSSGAHRPDHEHTGRRFFMRVRFEAGGDDTPLATTLAELEQNFSWVAGSYQMTWRIVEAAARTRTLIMVSKLGHCLNDLLFRWRMDALNINVAAIASNHPDFAPLAESYGIPFHHIPVTKESKPRAEARLLQLVTELDVELIVLARYMQVLSPDVCEHLEGRVINIHHSFLPSFKGANPYGQAHDRGVKLIGATAHYVTPDLDEGPIIEQDVTRVDHSQGAAQLAAAGRDVEAQVLARAVRWHTEHRVLPNGDRTVVFT